MNNNNVDLLSKFVRLEWLLHRYHLQNHKHHGPMSDPHRGQGRILALLKSKPEISQKELSIILDMRPQSLGEFLKKLEKNGYITRIPSQKDRRIMNIHLTETGKKVFLQSKQDITNEALFECLNNEEQVILNNYIERITLSLEHKLNFIKSEPDLQNNTTLDDNKFNCYHNIGNNNMTFNRKNHLKHTCDMDTYNSDKDN